MIEKVLTITLNQNGAGRVINFFGDRIKNLNDTYKKTEGVILRKGMNWYMFLQNFPQRKEAM